MKRPITEFKNIHEGKDIWVIASDSSMDYVEPSFFENKITIGVNEVYRKYKYCSYYLRKEFQGMEETINHIKGVSPSSKLIVSEYEYGGFRERKNEINTDIDYWYFNHLENERQRIDFNVIGTDSLVVSWSTITSAIHFAVYLGAKNIILCGHDCGRIDGKVNFDGYDTEKELEAYDWYKDWLKEIFPQTIQLKEGLKKLGINIYSLNPFIGLNLEGHHFL